MRGNRVTPSRHAFPLALGHTHARTHTHSLSSLCHAVQFSATRVGHSSIPKIQRQQGQEGITTGKTWSRSRGGAREGGAESRAGWNDQWLGAPDSCRRIGTQWLQVASALLVPLCGASELGQSIQGEGSGLPPHTSPLCRGWGTGAAGRGRAGRVAAWLSSGAPQVPHPPLPRHCRRSTKSGCLEAAA